MLLTAAGGQCIRFPVTDVRVFTGRNSMGVRGIKLAEDDAVISLAILRHVEATSDERAAYSRCDARSPAKRGGGASGAEGEERSGAIRSAGALRRDERRSSSS